MNLASTTLEKSNDQQYNKYKKISFLKRVHNMLIIITESKIASN
jgi:hypothetical protein